MKRDRWIELNLVFALCVAASLLLPGIGRGAGADDSKAAGPDLTGVIKGQDGQPLGGATVFIYTAGPKEGAGILCPSCYADCRKRATTDTAGHFKIESLNPTLLFRVLVAAKGHRPEFVSKVDPALKPIEVTLKVSKADINPAQQLKGRVVDTDGKPLSGAVVSIRGVSRGDSTRFGGNDDIDQVAVTDGDGKFLINGETPFDAAGVEVEARACAKGIFEHLATGGKVHELKLTEGGAVKGRLVKDGRPVSGAEVGVCGADRRAEIYVGDFSIGTDKEGKFSLPNLPPNRDYFIYATMNSLREKGSVPARRARVNEDGSVVDVGDLQVARGYKLEGQIRLTDGKPLPPKTGVLLSRDEAWDSAQTEADAQGRFKFAGVPAESINLTARVKGYRLSQRNRSLDTMNAFELVGLVKADKTDLILEFEPGNERENSRGEYVDLRQEPLLGAEAVSQSSAKQQGDFHVTGKVIDAETQEPLKFFTVTEGRAQSFPETFQWLGSRQRTGTNGQLDVFLDKGRTAPAIMVEAEGYVPQSSGAISTAETNFTITLKKGTGPTGVVLNPDGTAASGVKVYLADMRNGVYVQDKSMQVQDRIYAGTRSTTTDEKGRFTFKPRVDDYAVLVLAEGGFAQVPVGELSKNGKVKLLPWGKVEGKLLIGTRPGTKETIHLGLASLPYEYHPRNFAPLGLYLQTQTDDSGQFSFERVPPLNVQVYHSPNVRDSKMGIIPTSQTTSFTVKPGEIKALTLGGKGRPVVGQLIVNGYEGKIDWRADVQTLELILPPNDNVPDMLALSREQSAKIQAADSDEEKKRLIEEMQKSREEAAAKQRAFYATEKGREYYFQNKRYALNFAQDGTFRIEDVPGGKYHLRIDLREGGEGPMRFSAPRIASLDKEFQIPDSPGGRSDEPFDLGKIEMQARKVLAVGKTAPDFEVKTVDDKTVKLSDLAGKYVLLDFWAVWCGPCVAETPYLKAAYEAFKGDPRFRMIGLSLDPKIAAPREYAQKNQLGWTIGFLGEWSKTDVPNQYGVEGIPSIFLIGPDGKIIAKDLRGENIKAVVEKALVKAESAKAQ
jgi:peroxiredoxin